MRRQQSGMVFIMFVAVLAVIGFGMVMGASTLQAQSAASRRADDRRLYLESANRKIAAWYQQHLSVVDTVIDAPDMDDVLAQAGVSRQYGMQAQASRRLDVGGVGFRRMVIWIPASAADATGFDINTGIFTPGAGVEYTLVDGLSMQQRAMTETRRTLTNIAVTLVNYFAARYELGGKDVSINYFRPDSACSSSVDGFPCIDSYASVASIDLSAAGLPALPTTDAWGNAIEISNLTDSNVGSPPYSMAIRSQTPFGTNLVLNAFQRL